MFRFASSGKRALGMIGQDRGVTTLERIQKGGGAQIWVLGIVMLATVPWGVATLYHVYKNDPEQTKDASFYIEHPDKAKSAAGAYTHSTAHEVFEDRGDARKKKGMGWGLFDNEPGQKPAGSTSK